MTLSESAMVRLWASRVARLTTGQFLAAALAIMAAVMIVSVATAEAAEAAAVDELFNGVYAEFTGGAGLLESAANWTLILPGLVIAHGLALLQFHAAAVLPAWLIEPVALFWRVASTAILVAVFVVVAFRVLLSVRPTETTVNTGMPLLSRGASWLTTAMAFSLLWVISVIESTITKRRMQVSVTESETVEVRDSDSEPGDGERFVVVFLTAFITAFFMMVMRYIGDKASYYADVEASAGVSVFLVLLLGLASIGYLYAWSALMELDINCVEYASEEVTNQ